MIFGVVATLESCKNRLKPKIKQSNQITFVYLHGYIPLLLCQNVPSGSFFLSKISTLASRKATFRSRRQSLELSAARRPEQLMEKALRNSVIRLIEPELKKYNFPSLKLTFPLSQKNFSLQIY